MYCGKLLTYDDQAIMGFQGADVEAFLSATEDREVLHKSYRLPESVWHVAQSVVSRIRDRAPKDWSPRDEDGTVQQHQSLWDVPLDSGDWCILARTNRIASQYADALRDEGWVYSRNGRPSIPPKIYDAIMSWEDLTKGKNITSQEIRNVYTHMKADVGYKKGFGPRSKALLSVDDETMINMDYARDHLGLLQVGDIRWHQALDKITRDMEHYLLNALRRGDNVKNPRIKVSTIHSMKGGEADNVLVIPDLSYAADREYQRNPSTEHRVFYVAVTRARQSLHIMEPITDKYYTI